MAIQESAIESLKHNLDEISKSICRNLDDHYFRYIYRFIDSGLPPQLDLSLRVYEEMTLCKFIDYFDKLEELMSDFGYELVDGEVRIGRFNGEHSFFYNGEDKTIVCPTFGQFADYIAPDEVFYQPGQRVDFIDSFLGDYRHSVQIIKLNSPDPNWGGNILIGEIYSINESLGLEYLVD